MDAQEQTAGATTQATRACRRTGPAEAAAILWDRLGGFPRPFMEKEPEKAQECSAYKPTQEELVVLARHWVMRRVDVLHGRVMYRTEQEDAYAATRLARIMTVVGEDAVRAILIDLAERGEFQVDLWEGREQDDARTEANAAWGCGW